MRAKLTTAFFVVAVIAYALSMAGAFAGGPLQFLGARVSDASAQAERLGE